MEILEEDVMKKPPTFNEDGLFWMGVTGNKEDGYKTLRYEPSTNRVYIKSKKGNYISLGDLIARVELDNGFFLPVVLRKF